VFLNVCCLSGHSVSADLASIAAFLSSPSCFTFSTTISVHCLSASFASLSEATAQEAGIPLLCSIPDHWVPQEGPGILIDVTGDDKWRPLAEGAIRLLGQCAIDAPLLVGGLVSQATVEGIVAFFRYGDGSLHMVSELHIDK
jgi:hypothetical protein